MTESRLLAVIDIDGAQTSRGVRRRGDYRPARVMKVERLGRLSEQATVAVFADWMPAQPTLFDAQEIEGRT